MQKTAGNRGRAYLIWINTPNRGYRPHFSYLSTCWLPVAVKTVHNPKHLGYITLPARPGTTHHRTPLAQSGRHRGLMARWRHGILPGGRPGAPPTPRRWPRGVARNMCRGDAVRHPALTSRAAMSYFRMHNFQMWPIILFCEIRFEKIRSGTILSK